MRYLMPVVLLVGLMVGCSENQAERMRELAVGQQPRTEEGIEAQKRCAVGSSDPVSCDAVARTLQADGEIFKRIAAPDAAQGGPTP